MELYNLVYKNFDILKEFIYQSSIQDSNDILIQIFSSKKNNDDILKIRAELKKLLPNSSIIATSTAGIITEGKILDDETLISFSIFEFSTVKSKSYCHLTIDEIVNRISNDLLTNRTKLLICFVNTFTVESENLLKKISLSSPSVIIVGGNGADDFKFQRCHLSSDLCQECDVVFAAIDSDVLSVETECLLNYQTIGREMVVTKAYGPRIYEIDHKKILDVYEYYLGKEIRDNILEHGIEFPLIFNDGINIARAPIMVHDDGSLTFAGNIHEGRTVKFGYADIKYIQDYNENEILREYQYRSEAIYIYTCGARRRMLGSYLDEEISIINYIAPTTGFVSYGEFFHDTQNCSNNLLNITTTYVLLNEKKPHKIIDKKIDNIKKNHGNKITLKALTTLVSKTSDELDEQLNYLNQFKKAINEVSIFSVTNAKGIITDVNENFEVISGYTRDELIGKSHNMVRHSEMPEKTFKDMWESIQKGKIWKGIIKNRRKDGSEYFVLSEISPIYNKDGSFKEYIAVRNDITELEVYKQILKNELKSANNSLEENINYTKQYEEAINTTTAILKTNADNCITYANEKFCILSGYSMDELIGKNCMELRHQKHRDEETCINIKNILSRNEMIQYILTNVAKDGREYTINTLFYPIIDLSGEVVEYLQIMHDITEIIELNQEIESTQKEVVLTMGAIGETRSKETGLHVKRVAEYSYLLAKLSGLSEEESSLLKQASPMHDIGKVGIPDNVLNKPGKLSNEEFEIIKTHAEIGYEMLKHSNRSILQASAVVAYTHHEKWNGKGYPRGLKENEIPIYGRITAIADVFDALGHDRVYKKAWPLNEVLNLLKQERGKSFDPRLIDLFFDHLDEFLVIQKNMKD